MSEKLSLEEFQVKNLDLVEKLAKAVSLEHPLMVKSAASAFDLLMSVNLLKNESVDVSFEEVMREIDFSYKSKVETLKKINQEMKDAKQTP